MEHTHQHHHDHNHEVDDNEVVVLIRYLVNHNVSHTEELKELSESLKNNHKDNAYNKVLSAIEFYKKGNEELKNALEAIEKE